MQPMLTLNAIRAYGPCESGWRKLLKHLGKTEADDVPLPLLTVLDNNGLEDALWCFRALGPEWESWTRLLVCDLVQPAMKHTTDPRLQAALDVARRFAGGEASQEELAAAWAAVEVAVEAAARAAAEAAASAAARAVAWAAASAAAEAAARAAAEAAAWDAARAAAEAARDAAISDLNITLESMLLAEMEYTP